MKPSINLLMVKIGTEPGLEDIPRTLRSIDSRIKTFGVLSRPDQHHTFDVVVSSSYESALGAQHEYLRDGLYVRPELFEKIGHAEGRILRMYERVAIQDLSELAAPGSPIPPFRDSVDARSQLFLRHAAYWDFALRHHEIDAVVAQNYGHNGYDAVLYEVAKANGLPYMFFHEFRPFQRAQQMYESVRELESNALSSSLIEVARQKFPYLPDSPGRRELMELQVGLRDKPDSPVSISKPSFVSRVRRLKKFSDLPQRLARSMRRRRRNARSMRDERESCSGSALPERYLFCELQSQPNATTALKGWMFPDQRESIAMIAKHLPAGWKLVVKESDRQWSRMYPRRVGFWSHIAAVPNVHVVASTSSSRDLLDSSCGLVETSYSSLALRAIQLGIPVIVLGYTHIGGLAGVRAVVTDAEASQAVQDVCSRQGVRLTSEEVTASLTSFVDQKITASIEGTLSYVPKFPSQSEREQFIRRTITNASSVIAAWLLLRV